MKSTMIVNEKPKPKNRNIIGQIVPGIITGISDDDPSGIATYSQTGAQFGLAQLWTSLYQIPLLIAVQEACARIGATTGMGLAGVIKQYYSKKILAFMVLLVLIANVINIGADIGAVAAAIQLIFNAPFWLLASVCTFLIIGLEVFLPYRHYSKILIIFGLCILSYPLTTFMVHQDWGKILIATFVPKFEFNTQFLFIIIGVMGTSISPYMFFWQASEEVEEEEEEGVKHTKNGRPIISRLFIDNMRFGTIIGMITTHLGQWFIIITTATILNANHVTNIATAADAARALEPLVQSFPNSGYLAKIIFAIGIIGLGFMGIPILAGSAAYAISESMGWKEGLNRKFSEARGFYSIIIIACLIGLILNYIGIDPIKALIYTAVINGFAAVPLLFLIGHINGNKKIMGARIGGPLSRFFVWLTAAIMLVAAIGLVASYCGFL